jgi:hypothetical protein
MPRFVTRARKVQQRDARLAVAAPRADRIGRRCCQLLHIRTQRRQDVRPLQLGATITARGPRAPVSAAVGAPVILSPGRRAICAGWWLGLPHGGWPRREPHVSQRAAGRARVPVFVIRSRSAANAIAHCLAAHYRSRAAVAAAARRLLGPLWQPAGAVRVAQTIQRTLDCKVSFIIPTAFLL